MQKSLVLIITFILLNQIHLFPLNLNSQLVDEFTNEEYDAKEKISKPSSNLLLYYSWFASMGYCTYSLINEGKCCADILQSGWNVIDNGIDPIQRKYNYILLKSDTFKKYIIAFPGTRNPLELGTEIIRSNLVPFVPYSDMKISSYFKDRADGILNLVFSHKNLQNINNNPGYQVIFIGHSLGGAIASIMALHSISKINPIRNPPVLITYGQPRTGNKSFADEVTRKISIIFRVSRQGDLVSNVPPCVIKCNPNYYWHIGGLILLDKDMTSAIICPKEDGEYSINDCKLFASPDIRYHTRYFSSSQTVSKQCKP